MKRLLLAVLVMALPAAAMADWFDGFEDYAAGSSMHGQGGWTGWLNDPAATGYVSDIFAHEGAQSVAIAGASDLVHTYTEATSGTWTYTAWQYIPNDFTGQTYFIMLNQYGAVNNWSVQVQFTAGQVITDSPSGASLPWITGEWVEIKLVIDLDADIQTFYYNGEVLYVESWTNGLSGGGIPAIGAVDLFANGASEVYYDDMSLEGAVATESTTMGSVKALFR